MEGSLKITKKLSKSDRVRWRILEGCLELKTFKEYFGDTKPYKVSMGSRGVNHTKELFEAYERTAKYWQKNQEMLLDCILEIAAEQYKCMWEYEEFYFKADPPIYAEYEDAKEHYNQLMDKTRLKNFIKIARIHFIPILYHEICYAAVCLTDLSDYETYRVDTIWLILEENRLIGTDISSEKQEDKLYYINYVRSFQETGVPFLYWENMKSVQYEEMEVPQYLGRGGSLTKFKKLVPYLSNIKIEPAEKSTREDYFLPRGIYPIGQFNGMIYFLLKEKNRKLEDCPVFDVDGSLEIDGCMPLAENLLAFLKLVTMTHSFLSISIIARLSMEEYQKYKKERKDKWDLSKELNAIEENFQLPEIEDVYAYLNSLKKNEAYIKQGNEIIYKMYIKRDMKDEYYDRYEKK